MRKRPASPASRPPPVPMEPSAEGPPPTAPTEAVPATGASGGPTVPNVEGAGGSSAGSMEGAAPAEQVWSSGLKQYPELAFFYGLMAILDIELTEEPEPIAENLVNVQAKSTAKIKSLRLKVLVGEGDGERALTKAELGSVALREPRISLGPDSDRQMTHDAPNGKYFTVRDLVLAIEKTELKFRGESEWFGGIDVHHIFFEELELVGPASFIVAWGS